MSIKKTINVYKEAVLLVIGIVTAVNLVLNGFNALTLNNIKPFEADLKQVKADFADLKKDNADDISREELNTSYLNLEKKLDLVNADLGKRVDILAQRVGAIQDALIRR